MPDDLLNGDFHRVDADYTFTQWVVVFDFDGGGYVQVYVKPKRILLLPILNFEDDFEIDYVNYESN